MQHMPALNELQINGHIICQSLTEVELHPFLDGQGDKIYCNPLRTTAKMVVSINRTTVPRLKLYTTYIFAKLQSMLNSLGLKIGLNIF